MEINFVMLTYRVRILIQKTINLPMKQSNIKYNLLPQQFEQMQQMLTMIKNFN